MKLIAIGGGENGRILPDGTRAEYNTRNIDEEIVRLTNKKNPNYLFISHASPNKEIELSYFKTMVNIYHNIFNCNCDILSKEDLNDETKTNKKLNWADIIYTGGGDTKNMIKLWKKTNFDQKLYQKYQEGKVISGISAGAICYFNSFNSQVGSKLKKLNGLNWINLYVSPHIDEEGRMEEAKKQLKDLNKVGVLIPNTSALEIIDNTYKVINNNKKILKAYYKNNDFILEELKEGSLDELIEENQ